MGKIFTLSEEVFDWLSGFINLERGQKPKSFRIERMEILSELADHPERCAPSVHIAGSKGKGSVTSMLSAMLTAASYRTARYMSPHVIDIRERICLGDSYFDDDIYCSAGDELRNIVEERLPALHNMQPDAASLFFPSGGGYEPTFWELLTLLFFLCARKAKCDVMVAETGMGGRLDSTNVLDPLVSVITLIELEHTNFLGNSIEAVAGEKAGIIKTGKPLVLAKQCDEALKVFKEKSQKKNSPLFYFSQTAQLSNVEVSAQGTNFTLSFNADKNSTQASFFNTPITLSIPVPGKVQAENASLAIAALKIAFPQIGEDAVRKGLQNLKIPARFENITPAQDTETPPFIIDGAHTPESLALCVETFCSLYGEGGVLLFGCAADKNAAAMAQIAHSHFAKIFITTPGTFKASDPVKVYETFAEIAGEEKTVLVKDTQEAVNQAILFSRNSCKDTSNLGIASASNLCSADASNLWSAGKSKFIPILGTGSFYLVSEIRKIVCCSQIEVSVKH
jgi:dihydrofolate synthase/folylpolyglutamate synthase